MERMKPHTPNPANLSRAQFLRNAALILALLAVLLIALNAIFSYAVTWRWDLTQSKQFTLSPATVQLLQNLQATAHVKVFLSDNIPAPEHDLAQKTRDILTEFQAHAHGKLTFEIIHPKTELDEQVAKGFGLRKVAISQRDNAQRSIRLVFKGLTILYEDQAETIPEIRATDNLEYLLAKSIANLTAPKIKTVALIINRGGLAQSPILQHSMAEVFAEVFGKRIQLTTTHITEDCTLSTQADALLLLDITTALSSCDQFALEQAILQGQALAILQSPSQADYRQPDQPRIPFEPNLNPILPDGVRLNSDLLLDRTHNLVGRHFTQDNDLPVSLPALPILRDFDRTTPITQNLTALVFPFSGTLSIDENILQNQGADVSILVQSAQTAATRPAGGDIAHDTLNTPKDHEIPGPHPLAIALQTPYNATTTVHPVHHTPAPLTHTPSARFLIIANGEFLFANKIIGYSDDFAKYGIHLFINAIEWLVQDEALTQIRNRAVPPLLTPPDADTQSRIIKLNVIGVPILVLLLMLLLRLLRIRHARAIQKRFSRGS